MSKRRISLVQLHCSCVEYMDYVRESTKYMDDEAELMEEQLNLICKMEMMVNFVLGQ